MRHKTNNEPIRDEPQEVLKHNLALDGVRGVAIFLVVALHLFSIGSGPGGFLKELVFKVRSVGWVGVDLFFSLSGFLITGILFDSLRDKHYFRNFYFRRVLRIFPLYYGVILLCLAARAFVPSLGPPRTFLLLAAYLQNTPLWLPGAGGLVATLTDHFWSLAVEEQFYMVWPVVIFLVKDRRKLIWVAAGFALLALLSRVWLLAHGASAGEVYRLTICRADSLLGGAWLALMIRGSAKKNVLRYATPVFWAAIMACALMAWAGGDFDWATHRSISLVGYSVVAIACGSLLAMALRPNGVITHVMSLGILRFLGKYSYGIYIYHQIFFVLVNLFLADKVRKLVRSNVVAHLGVAFFVGSAAVLVAWVSFHFYEKRFLRLKRFFNYSAA